MKITDINIHKEAKKREYPIENKLLQFYIACQLVWSFLVAIMYKTLRMPTRTIRVYAGFFVSLLVALLLFRIFKWNRYIILVYMMLTFIFTPVIWYYSGSGRTSASILFVNEMILFIMCLKGKLQKIFTIASLVSISLVQRIVGGLEHPIYPMDERQYQIGGAILGLSTSLLIAFLLLRQKTEYARERDSAIESEKELAKSNLLQKNFLANMSHEIRSPLGIVMGFNNLIKDSDDIDQIHEYSKDITSAGKTLLAVINDILDYSKIESGKLDIIDVDYSFKDLIADIRRDISLKCEEKGLRFNVTVDEVIPQFFHGDNIRIKQCLINVLSNAVKYTEKGGVDFRINCLEREDDKYKLEFVVKDTGKGISEKALPNLFTAFQRLDEGMNRGIEGTGLGMAITKNLLDEMDGSISVESELGKGSVFTIVLWQKEGVSTAIENTIDDSDRLDDVKVLVVDDTALNLTLVKKLLDKEGAIVTTIDNGKSALIDMEVNKYDVILLDHMMPEMSGVEVFEAVKAGNGVNKKTPVVMLTANAMTGAMQEYLDMGFDDYISKPIAPKELKAVVHKFGVSK